MDRRTFLGSLAGAALASRKPNIVVVLADDMGFSDIGCFGGEVETPVLDGLARRGVRFTRGYNSARCCPSRAALLTGLYSHQAGIGRMVEDLKKPAYQGRLNDRCHTIAEALKASDYRTLLSGKWHVGENRPLWPVDRGFDRSFSLISGASNYYSLDPGRKMALDDKPVELDRYITDAFTDHAIEFLKDQPKQKPFFLYLPYTAPHWPLHALESEIKKYRTVYRAGWDEIRARRHKRQVEMGIVDPRWKVVPRDEKVPA